MTNWTNPWQPPASPPPNQLPVNQLPPLPLRPVRQRSQLDQLQTPNLLPLHQPSVGQQLLPPLQPIGQSRPGPLPSYQKSAGRQPQLPESQLPLRERYTPEQINLYFTPLPDRGPKIRELKHRRNMLCVVLGGLALINLVLVILFMRSPQQVITKLGVLEFVTIFSLAIFIFWLTKRKLLPLNDELHKEINADRKEKEYIRKIKPPDEKQYDEWINAIRDDTYKKAPKRLRLHEHSEHKAWRKTVNSELCLPLPSEPGEFGASVYLEGFVSSDETSKTGEQPPQMDKWTTLHGCKRIKHYSIYVFTAFFVTEDYIAIYTSTVNLRDSTRDREEFEYCYHQHLSHMLLNVNTRRLGSQKLGQIAFQENGLSLTFDSGRTIKRSISTLQIGDQYITDFTNFADIHEKLTKALIDHERSIARSIEETKSLG